VASGNRLLIDRATGLITADFPAADVRVLPMSRSRARS